MSRYEEGVAAHKKGNYKKAFAAWSQAAEAGDAEAQCQLGLLHGNGQGVKQDFVKARKWFLKASEAGYAEAEYSLGVLYAVGLGCEADAAEGA